MATTKFNPNGHGNAKAGRDNTKVILTSAGVAAAAAGAAAAAHVFGGKEEEEPVENPEEVTSQEESVVENEEQKQEDAQQATSESETESTAVGEDIAQPQPTTGNASQSNPSPEPTPSSAEDETPQEVAEAIAHAEEIDNNDIDAPAMVEIDKFTSAFDENGNEIAAVEVHSQDGTPFLLADMDNDGVYESMFDTDGNFVTHTEANLTHSDLEAMMDQTGGFLAINEQDHTSLSEDPTNDIIDTETGAHPDMAMNETPTSETTEATSNPTGEQDLAQEPTADEIDNLLAELLGDNTDPASKDVDEEVLVDEYPEGEEESDDDDDADDDAADDTNDDDDI